MCKMIITLFTLFNRLYKYSQSCKLTVLLSPSLTSINSTDKTIAE